MSIFTISTKIYFVEMNYLSTQFDIDGYGLSKVQSHIELKDKCH